MSLLSLWISHFAILVTVRSALDSIAILMYTAYINIDLWRCLVASSFSPQVATRLISENPGRSAQEIVRDALDRGVIRTRGRNRIAGQVGALAAMYNRRRLPEVWRDEHHRPYRYYLKGATSVQPSPKLISEPITFRPTPRQEEILTALTETRKFSSRSEAIIWILDQGIAANQEDIRRIIDAYKEIEQLRRKVQQIRP
jgi:metal-responsive CopG/Arc/MetJ family transcriptional regulator